MASETSWFNSLSQRDRRALMFHILYAAESGDYETSVESLADMLNRGFSLEIPLNSDLMKTCESIINERDQLDEIYKSLLANWRFERLGVSTRLILRFAIWELTYTDINSTIIINEAIELAKCFAEQDSYKFINGILDEVVKQNLIKHHS